MEFQVTPWIGIYSVALAVTMVLVGYAVWNYRRRAREPLNLGLAAFMLGIGLVQLGTLVAHVFVEPGVNVWATNVINALFFPTMVFGFVGFILLYVGATRWVTRRTVGFAGGHLVFLCAVVLARPDAFVTASDVATTEAVTVMGLTVEAFAFVEFEEGLFLEVYRLYLLLWVLLGLSILFWHLYTNWEGVSPVNVALLGVGILAPFLAGALTALGVLSLGVSALFVPATLGLTAVCFAGSVFGYRLLEVETIGREQTIAIMDDPVVIIDREDRVVDANPAAEALFDVEVWEGMHVETFLERVAVDPEQLLAETTSHPEGISIERRGKTRYFDRRTQIIRDDRNTPVGRLLILHEITRLKESQSELDLLKQLFSRVFRHNIRNELAVVTGYMDLIAGRSNDETVVEGARTALTSTERLLSHTEKAREIERLIDSDPEPVERPIDELVGDAAKDVSAPPEATIRADDLPGSCVTVVPGFEIAVQNALENALEHNPESVTVEVEAIVNSETVELVVSDDGNGMEAAEAEVLATETETALSHGSGVGLWVIKWFVEKSGGELTIDSNHHGTTVQMTLHRA